MWPLILLEHFVVGKALSLNLFLFNTVHFLEDTILDRQIRLNPWLWRTWVSIESVGWSIGYV